MKIHADINEKPSMGYGPQAAVVVDGFLFNPPPAMPFEQAKASVTLMGASGEMRQALADLLEWEAEMGGYGSPAWTRARALMDRLRDHGV